MGKVWRPRRPAEAPLEAVVGVKDARGAAPGKMRRPRPRRPAKEPLKAVGVKDAIDREVEASMLEAPVVAAARGGEKGPLEVGTAGCLMDSPVVSMTRQEAVRVKDAEGVAVRKMWRPRRPAKVPLNVVGVKDAIDGEVEASMLEARVVAAAKGGEKGPLEDGTAGCLMDSLDGAPVIAVTRQEAVRVKHAQGVAVGKMWRPRRSAKAPLNVVGVKAAIDREVEVSMLEALVVAVAKGGKKGPLENGTAVCLMDSLDGAPVIAMTRQEAVRVKHAQGVAVGKMWQPQRQAKVPLNVVGVKDTKGVAVIAVDGEVKASGQGAPMVVAVGSREKGPLEGGIAMCRMDALDGAPINAATRQEAMGVKNARGVALGKMWRPRQPAKAPRKAVGVEEAERVDVIVVDGEVEASVLGALVVAAAMGWKKGPLEDGADVCLMDSLDGAPVNARIRQEAVGVKDAEGITVVAVDGGGEKRPHEEGIEVCQMDSLNGAQIIATTRHEAVGVNDAKGVAVGKMWRPRRPAKAPMEVLGLKDTEGVAEITIDWKVKASVLRPPVVVVADGGEKGPPEEGIVGCRVDTLDGAMVIATTQQEVVGVKDAEEVAVGKMWRPRRPAKAPLEAVGVKDAEGVAVITGVREVEPLVLGGPVVAAAGDGEKGSLEDGIVVCRMDALDGASVIAIDEKEEVSVQGEPLFPGIDQKVDAPVVEGMQAITVKGNGKEEKAKEGIKWLRHYSTAQSILIIGDGDFSFSLALATTFGSGGNLVATSLDSYGALTRKYGKAESNVTELKRLGATVLHGVDAKTMKLHSYLEMRRFDRIVFNFPHAGFKGKEDQLHVINAHKQLVHGFFANASHLLRPYGETHLSHKTGFPYDAWGIEQLAYESCLIMARKVDFSKEDYPGYNQKRGDGATCDESFPLGHCCTFMFCVGDVEKLRQAHGNWVGSISSCLGDSKFYPGISATHMMWPFDLHPTWPQPHFAPAHMPIAFDPCPFGVAEMVDPFNCYGTYFHHRDMVQPWYQEHQSLQREYEIHRQLTLSLEDRYMESVEWQAMLEMLIQVYGGH